MDAPLITIGITCYNAAETIESAIQSAFEQTWPDREIIVVDDSSTDESPAILKKIKESVPVLTIIRHKKNKGVAAARNTLIAAAQGEFIAFFDDDDHSSPERLQKQYQRITSYEDTFAERPPVICHTARTQIYPDGTRHYEPTMGTNDGPAPLGPAVAERILTGKPTPHIFGSTATCSQMARKTTYEALSGFDETLKRSEDTDFNVRAALSGAHFPGLAEPLVTQTMTRSADKNIKDEKNFALKLLEKHRDFIDQKSSYDFCRRWLLAKYDFLQGRKIKFAFQLLGFMLNHPKQTINRLLWAWPNIKFNLQFKKFHNESH